ncbi:MAG: response regulator [Candidatus Omnitrophica bacterium]|nr:response regulator [Candidatus Omnitrophota bacterium]
MAELLKARLETAGFHAHVETTGGGGLSYAAEHRPDLVLLDLRLPDIDGYRVCRELRRIYHPWDVPVLMLTAMAQPIDELRGFAHGADVYLTKPFQAEELLKSVNLLVGVS